jgi:uncharacterized protein
MMMGMGLFKLGFFNLAWDKKLYWIIGLAGLVVGYALIIVGVKKNFAADWNVKYSMFFGSLWNYHGSLLVAMGYASLVMLLVNRFKMKLLANVGKMAFTNYLLTTLICTFIFYGHGLGLLGQLERWEQVVLMLGIWVILIIFSWWWLRQYQMGPMEWLWRYLTYGNKPAFIRK